ncbi:MAG TPA: hypothetical protein PLG34_05360 [Spirochaetota bacterium]|jgi:tetratricopeptide (TPR) repeat protein|nr:MAG: Tetratricopeptide repeat protein [Spirochaetes bacterium ADurb.Bin133]HNZ27700.1 hypothetical protein [Spirochaetota bacterium]HPY87392.1 hypothetical protein [Spirochaetota bacterium]
MSDSQDKVLINERANFLSLEKNSLIADGKVEKFSAINFDVKYWRQEKNFIISFTAKSDMDQKDKELRFYFRYKDSLNHCYFSLKDGKFIKFSVIKDAEPTFQTSWIKITDQNLFKDKYNFFLSVFEDTTTVIIDETVVMNIDHTPDLEGDIGIQFISEKKTEIYNIIFENFSISTEILNFEHILNMPKRPDVFFMQGNDFYEQNRYDLSLYYYNKGLLYGRADDKIYNRVGNLYYLFEQYPEALSNYSKAAKLNEAVEEYRINYGRALIKTNRDTEAIELLGKIVDGDTKDVDLLTDYSTIWLKNNDYQKGLEYLNRAYLIDPNSPTVLIKLGKALIDTGELDEGKEKLLQAANSISKTDPAGAAIILKYSVDKKPDVKSVKALAKLLYERREYREVYELIKQSRVSIFLDEELIGLLLEAEIELGLLKMALTEIDNIEEKDLSPKLSFLKAKILILNGDYKKSLKIIDDALKREVDKELLNKIICQKLILLSKSGKVKESKKYFERANPKYDGYDDVLIEYGKILTDIKDFDGALEIFSNINKDVGLNAEVLYNIGLAYLGKDKYDKAKEALGAAMNEVKDSGVIYSYVVACYRLNDFREAISTIELYRAILPKDGSVENLLGNVYLSKGDIVNAQKYYYKALDIDRDNGEFALNLAESFYKSGDYKNAYMITKQLIDDKSFDRAYSLHLRIKSHLYQDISCDVCSKKWTIEKESVYMEEMTPKELDGLPKDAPSGFCQKCAKYFCRGCMGEVSVEEAVCPYCKEKLIFNNGLKAIASKILKGQL